MKFQVVVEHDQGSGHHTATVIGIPAIVVDAKTEAAAVRLAREAIEFFLEQTQKRPESERVTSRSTVRAKIVAVDVPT